MAFARSTTNRKSRGSNSVVGFNNKDGDYTQAMAVVNGNNEFVDMTSDSFGRLRTSHLYPMFETNTRYDIDPTLWTTIGTVGGASSTTIDKNEAAIILDAGNVDGEQAALRSLKNFRYQAGKSQLIMQTVSIVNPDVTTCTREWGYYDEDDGIYWVINNGVFGVCLRNRGVSEFVAQSDFNRDKLDGTGPSGFNIDLSKSNIYGISFQYLGVGIARLFVYDEKGSVVTAHVFENANKNVYSYMSTAVLPLSYLCLNTGPVTTAGGMNVLCATVNSEAGSDPVYSIVKSADTGAFITEAVGAEKSILSIQAKDNIENPAASGPVKNKVEVVPKSLSVACEGQAAIVRIRKNSTLASAVFVSAGDESSVNIDKTDVAAVDGELLATYVINKDTSKTIDIFPTIFAANRSSITKNNAGDKESITITIAKATGGSAGANTDVLASLTWAEIR